MPASHDFLRELLCVLGKEIRTAIRNAADSHSTESLSLVDEETAADTIYSIDRHSEEAIVGWLQKHWPVDEPARLVMEGIPDNEPVCFPEGTRESDTLWTLIIDPIDGTRGIMYDKRSAWALAALAPHRNPGDQMRLLDLKICATTELPTRKQAWADQMSCTVGEGIVATTLHLETGVEKSLINRPSRAQDFRHGFSSLVKFFPEGRVVAAQIEEAMWKDLGCFGLGGSPVIFDDQFISTGGQFHEILVGHDRMIADLRPAIYRHLAMPSTLVCHPYDACCWPLLSEAGAVFCGLDGAFPDAPLDTTSPVSWIAFANQELARQGLPALQRAFRKVCRAGS